MKKRWENEKDEQGNLIPNEQGEYVLHIENNAGRRVSSFRGKSFEEVTEQLADAQVHANRQLGRLLRPDRARVQQLRPQPRELSPEDRLRLSSEVTQPDTVVEAVNEIVTASQGAPPKDVAERVSTHDKDAADAYYAAEANAFVADHPDYYPVQQNQEALFRELERRQYDLTRNNLAIVYEALQEEGRIIPWPESAGNDEEGEEGEESGSRPTKPAAPPPNPPPQRRSISSGLRSSDASAMRPPPPKPKPLVTRVEIERMSRAEFQERLRDPAFRKAVDALA